MDGEQLHQMDKLKEETKRIASTASLSADDSLSPHVLMMPPVGDASAHSKSSSYNLCPLPFEWRALKCAMLYCSQRAPVQALLPSLPAIPAYILRPALAPPDSNRRVWELMRGAAPLVL